MPLNPLVVSWLGSLEDPGMLSPSVITVIAFEANFATLLFEELLIVFINIIFTLVYML